MTTIMELHRSEMRSWNPLPEPDQSPITIPEGPNETDTVRGAGARRREAGVEVGVGVWAVSLETTMKIPMPHLLSRSSLILIQILRRVVRRITPSLKGREGGGEGKRGGRERRGRRRRNGGEGRRRRRRGEGKREKRKEERSTKRRRKTEIRKRVKKGLSRIHGASMESSGKLICGICSSFPLDFFLYNVLILLRIQCLDVET